MIDHSKPGIFNTNQGVQFPSLAFTEILKREVIAISMDVRGRALSNILDERLSNDGALDVDRVVPVVTALCRVRRGLRINVSMMKFVGTNDLCFHPQSWTNWEALKNCAGTALTTAATGARGRPP